ncbi:5'-methylthioadenosine nucleosidase @ S-adenosylhomocysteine nucleosidase [hydrothermal vent metagenome]|uniref:adenosylhomocysteine nucleosidase n=1 Tax=hydrothermal vent metagenome TaxID=652676 RepID=A0A3B0W4N5_9ZZZZ
MSRIGIIGAMHLECEFFRDQLIETSSSLYLDIKITHGTWAGHDVCLLESGIGKVNATLATEWLAREFQPDLVINTGSAGGIKAGVQVGDFVFADQVCHHDVDVSPIGFKFGELPHLPVYYPIKQCWLQLLDQVATDSQVKHHVGTIATGESFIYHDHQVAQIKLRFDEVVACEMEAAAVAQVCYLHGIDCLILRNLSDVAGNDAQANFNQYIEQAGKKSTALVLAFMASLNQY